MKIEHMEQQKNKLLVDTSAPDLNGMLCSLCQKIALSVCQMVLPSCSKTQCGDNALLFTNILVSLTYKPVFAITNFIFLNIGSPLTPKYFILCFNVLQSVFMVLFIGYL